MTRAQFSALFFLITSIWLNDFRVEVQDSARYALFLTQIASYLMAALLGFIAFIDGKEAP